MAPFKDYETTNLDAEISINGVNQDTSVIEFADREIESMAEAGINYLHDRSGRKGTWMLGLVFKYFNTYFLIMWLGLRIVWILMLFLIFAYFFLCTEFIK